MKKLGDGHDIWTPSLTSIEIGAIENLPQAQAAAAEKKSPVETGLLGVTN
jgi:hypothetical protein